MGRRSWWACGRLTLFGLAVGLLAVSTAPGQTCAELAADTARSAMRWVEPHPPDAVSLRTRELAIELGYTGVEVDTGPPWELRALKHDWPRTPQVNQWRDLPYPGARLRVSVDRVQDWATIEVEVRLLCAPAFTPPARWARDINVQAFVLHHTLGDVTGQLASHFHDAPTEVAGRSCASLQEGDRKIRICREIARARPDDLDAHVDDALSLIRFFRAKQARGPIRRALELSGERFDVFHSLGTALLDEHEYDEAARLYRRAAELWPDSAVAHARLSLAMAFRGKRRQALVPLERAIALGTREPDVYCQAALALKTSKKDDARAIDYFRQALALYRDVLPGRRRDARTWAAMGRAAAELGRHAEAVSFFERVHVLDPTYLGRDRELRNVVRRSLEVAGPQPAAPMPEG